MEKNCDIDFFALVGKDVRLHLKTGEEVDVTITGWEGYDDDNGKYVQALDYVNKKNGKDWGVMDYEVESAEIIDSATDE